MGRGPARLIVAAHCLIQSRAESVSERVCPSPPLTCPSDALSSMARRPPATRLLACAWMPILLLLISEATAQELPQGHAVPSMTEALQQVFPEYQREESSFWDLWQYALDHDAPRGPVIRGSSNGGEWVTPRVMTYCVLG